MADRPFSGSVDALYAPKRSTETGTASSAGVSGVLNVDDLLQLEGRYSRGDTEYKIPENIKRKFGLQNPEFRNRGYEGTATVKTSEVLNGIAPDWMTLDDVSVTYGQQHNRSTDPAGGVHKSGTRARGVGAGLGIGPLGVDLGYIERGLYDDPNREFSASATYPLGDGRVSGEFRRNINPDPRQEDETYVGGNVTIPFQEGGIASLPKNPVLGGQEHMLAYITPEEASTLREQGGGVTPDGGQRRGPGGIASFWTGTPGSEAGGGHGGYGGGMGGGGGGHGAFSSHVPAATIANDVAAQVAQQDAMSDRSLINTAATWGGPAITPLPGITTVNLPPPSAPDFIGLAHSQERAPVTAAEVVANAASPKTGQSAPFAGIYGGLGPEATQVAMPSQQTAQFGKEGLITIAKQQLARKQSITPEMHEALDAYNKAVAKKAEEGGRDPYGDLAANIQSTREALDKTGYVLGTASHINAIDNAINQSLTGFFGDGTLGWNTRGKLTSLGQLSNMTTKEANALLGDPNTTTVLDPDSPFFAMLDLGTELLPFPASLVKTAGNILNRFDDTRAPGIVGSVSDAAFDLLGGNDALSWAARQFDSSEGGPIAQQQDDTGTISTSDVTDAFSLGNIFDQSTPSTEKDTRSYQGGPGLVPTPDPMQLEPLSVAPPIPTVTETLLDFQAPPDVNAAAQQLADATGATYDQALAYFADRYPQQLT
jgi:hypothetical protein